MSIENLLEIADFSGQGYQPLIDYQSWRVAVLRYLPDLLPDRLEYIESHLETDEVFILLEGRCILFLAEHCANGIGKIHAVNMEPRKLYNVRKGVYHTHTLSDDAHVIIVENQDTSEHNSARIKLDPFQVEELVKLTREQWEG
jgi:hypothetical protein